MINVIQNNEVYEISFSYDEHLVELIKNVPGKEWHPESKIWTVPKDRLGFFLNQVKGTFYENKVNIVSQEHINVNQTLDDTTNIPNVDISNVKLYYKKGCNPYEHQLDFMKYALYRQIHARNMNGFVLADDPGLGKTSEVMNLALYNKRNHKFKHCLIICCVNTAKYNWYNDIIEHTDGKYHPYILGTRLKKDGTCKREISSSEKLEDLMSMHMYGTENAPKLPYFLVTNIESLRHKSGKYYPFVDRIIELINSGQINMIAIDEIHKNASPSSTQGKQILRIKKYTGDNCMWIPLTGTPIVKRPTDCFIPLKLINAHNYTQYYMWCKHFCIFGGFGDKEIMGYKNIPELKYMLQSNMLRRLKDKVLDLPPIIFNDIYIDNSSYQSKLYSKVAEELTSQESTILESLNPMTYLLKLRQVNGSPELVDSELILDDSYINKNSKLKELLRILEDIHDRGEKVIIFSNWVEPLRTLYKFICKKYHVCVYTGTLSDSKKEEQKRKFTEDSRYTVLLGTIGAAGTSHTFTVADNVIFYDEPWNYADKQQAWERAHRIGTTKTVNVYTLLSRNTVDDTVHNIVYTKKHVSSYIIDGQIDLRKNPELFDLLLSDRKNIL